MGSVEFMNLYNAIYMHGPKTPTQMLAINAGINCRDEQEFALWVELYFNAVGNLDWILGWNGKAEDEFLKQCALHVDVCREFADIEPFSHGKDGWHYGLKDKKVLVVSSFKDSIEAQVPNYGKIWEGAEIGPVEVVSCPQPYQITGEEPSYFTGNCYHMIEQIAHKDFDLCIIGAGGYSLILCDAVKNLGKQAIHLGGATQVLFGIKGSRFDRNFEDQDWYGTKHFISPLKSDIPKNHWMVENSCYW